MRKRLDDHEIVDIFTNYDSTRLQAVFDNESLVGMDEVLVDIFNGAKWKDPAFFNDRNDFVRSVGSLTVDPDDHRRVFSAMAEAANSHAVIAYLHAIGHQNNVFLKDHSALMTAADLAFIVQASGPRIGSCIHFLSRAVTSGQPSDLNGLWKAVSKTYNPEARFKERFQEAMKTLVTRFGVSLLGLDVDDRECDKWVKQFYISNDPKTVGVASAVIAGQIASAHMSKDQLIAGARDLSGRVRLTSHFDVELSKLGIAEVKRSRHEAAANYRI